VLDEDGKKKARPSPRILVGGLLKYNSKLSLPDCHPSEPTCRRFFRYANEINISSDSTHFHERFLLNLERFATKPVRAPRYP
jgi:hypothetical protein